MTESPSTRRWLFTLTILTGSFLLFLVQPMVARMALPRLGGAPNVWNSAMLVYQALLLGGYAYAHALSRLAPSRQGMIHLGLCLLGALTLPLGLAELAPARSGFEAVWVLGLFLVSVGPVFFLVSAQAPLLQRWFASQPRAGNPYPLYAASNLGSFAGLLAYPLLAEPLLTVRQQSLVWSVGYGALLLLTAVVAFSRPGSAKGAETAAAEGTGEAQGEAPGWRRILLWLALAAVPSGLMLSTTTYVTTDLMAMPLLWVIPLGLYLLSYTVAFADGRRLASALVLVAPPVLVGAGSLAMLDASRLSLLAPVASLVLLFVVATALHSRLYENRPDPARLTTFYLVIAAGGALGGLFAALIAPFVFDWTWEHPLLMVAAAALLPLRRWARLLDFPPRRLLLYRAGFILLLLVALLLRQTYAPHSTATRIAREAILILPLIAIAILLAKSRALYATAAAALFAGLTFPALELTLDGSRSRSYFGVYTVGDGGGQRRLVHGTTVHGLQWQEPGKEDLPTTYYGPDSGIGLSLRAVDRLFDEPARVGIVGLGVGTLACYRRPGQDWTFFEIDPAVLQYSRRGDFTFLERCAPDAAMVIGDARIELEKMPSASFDILAIDAFSSDAIPLHLLTREALDLYLHTLAPDGLVLFHISNRFIHLEPVLATLARERGLAARLRIDKPDTKGLTDSVWVAIARDAGQIETLVGDDRWRPLNDSGAARWTDGYASILPHLIWRNVL